jgi:serine/threonine protein phosphatase PrpC
MQGWRKSQEDAHIAELELTEDTQLFAVFDGHGGSEVSIYVKKYLVEELRKMQSFKQKNYEAALKELYHKMDEMMLTPAGSQELHAIAESFRGTPNFDEERLETGSISQMTGCTAVVVLITPKHIYCANAGDSRGVLATENPDSK